MLEIFLGDNMNNKSILGTEKIGKLIFKLSIPMILAQLVNLAYNMVDRIFIGRLENIGHIALGGVGVCFPIIIIISALSALFGMGGAPLASIKLGEGKIKEAEDTLNNSFWLILITSIILIPIMFIFKEPILVAFGANNENIIYANEYLNIYILGTFFVMISLGLNQYISGQGFSGFAMISVCIGAILNIILDPIFIFLFDLGVSGAALATIISQLASSIFVLIFFSSKKTHIKINFKKITLNKKIIKSICLLGIAPFIMQSTEALVQISFNNQIKAYYPESTETLYLTSMTILLSLMSLVSMPLHGFVNGCQSIISYNYGAKNYKRVKECVFIVVLIAGLTSFILSGAIIVFPKFFIGIFSNESSIIEIASPLTKIFFFGMLFMGIQIGCQTTFLALGKSLISIALAGLRKIVLLIPLTFILPLFMKAKGIYFAEMISDLIAISTTLITFIIIFPKIIKQKDVGVINE